MINVNDDVPLDGGGKKLLRIEPINHNMDV
jgi:hypothetical protein